MDIILKYFPSLNIEQIKQFSELNNLYNYWNSKINVISRKDIEHLYTRHILHSLAIAKIINFLPGAKILDIGTGGGFPGIPLAIMFPESSFHLIDSVGKKIKVVKEISKELKLENLTAQHIRAEAFQDKYDFIVSRAVMVFPKFVKLVSNKIAIKNQHDMKNGILYLKGGDFEDEIKQYKKNIKIFQISDFFDEEFFETKKIIYLPK